MSAYFQPTKGDELGPYLHDDDIKSIHHLARYNWAKEIVVGSGAKFIADIGCGVGYGTYILSQHNNSSIFIGLDRSNAAVAVANEKFARHNIHYVVDDICIPSVNEWPIVDIKAVDLICAFEVIASTAHRELFLLNVSRRLTKDGLLLLSTPCSHYRSSITSGQEHENFEFGYKDLTDLLKIFFHEVITYDDAGFMFGNYWRNVVNKEKLRYDNKYNPIICRAPRIYADRHLR